MIPGGNPADALKQIEEELKQKFDEAGMSQVEEFTDGLDDIQEKLKKGPKELLEAAKDKLDEFKGKLQSALDDPSSLAPSGGGLATCASWYGNAVAGKLKDFSGEAEELAGQVTQMASDIAGPFQTLGETLDSAMDKLDASIKSLAKLPALVGTQIAGKDSPDDIAKIDCGPMKKAVAGGDVDGPLSSIAGLKDVLGGVVEIAEKGVETFQNFIDNAPDMIKKAFDVPTPLCFLTNVLLAQAPQAMTDLLEMVDKLKEIDLEPLITMCRGAAKSICGLDVEMVKTPISAFQESAGPLIDKLEKTVKGAKMASNPAGAIGGMFGK